MRHDETGACTRETDRCDGKSVCFEARIHARTWVVKQFAADDATALLKESALLIEPIQQMGVILFLFLFVFTPSLA